MSRSVDLFIRTDRAPGEMAPTIAGIPGLEVVEDTVRGCWTVSSGDVEAELREHPFIDDGDLPLGRYRLALSATVASDIRIADAPETAFLRMVSESLQAHGYPTLLVHDLQYRDRPPAPPEGERSDPVGAGAGPDEGGGRDETPGPRPADER